MGVNSLHKTATRQRRDYDLNPGPFAPESSTLTTRVPSHSIVSLLASIHYAYTQCAELCSPHMKGTELN